MDKKTKQGASTPENPVFNALEARKVSAGSNTPEDIFVAVSRAVLREYESLPQTEEERAATQWKPYRVSAKEPTDSPRALLEWQGISFLQVGDIAVLKAKPKAGKTHASELFAAAFLSGDCDGLHGLASNEETLLWIDTEQQRRHTARIAKYIEQRAGEDASQRAFIYNARQLSVTDRAHMLIDNIKAYKPSLVVIDGIVDFVRGMEYNDQAQADSVIQVLLEIAENPAHPCAVVCVIHENANNDNASGWLGRDLWQKGGWLGQVKEDSKSNIRTIACANARDNKTPDIDFVITDEGARIGGAAVADAIARAQERKASKDIFSGIDFGQVGLTHAQLVGIILQSKAYDSTDETATARATRGAELTISNALRTGRIRKSGTLYINGVLR